MNQYKETIAREIDEMMRYYCTACGRPISKDRNDVSNGKCLWCDGEE